MFTILSKNVSGLQHFANIRMGIIHAHRNCVTMFKHIFKDVRNALMYHDFNNQTVTPRETLSLANLMYFQKFMLRKIGKLITTRFWTLSFFSFQDYFSPLLIDQPFGLAAQQHLQHIRGDHHSPSVQRIRYHFLFLHLWTLYVVTCKRGIWCGLVTQDSKVFGIL